LASSITDEPTPIFENIKVVSNSKQQMKTENKAKRKGDFAGDIAMLSLVRTPPPHQQH